MDIISNVDSNAPLVLNQLFIAIAYDTSIFLNLTHREHGVKMLESQLCLRRLSSQITWKKKKQKKESKTYNMSLWLVVIHVALTHSLLFATFVPVEISCGCL